MSRFEIFFNRWFWGLLLFLSCHVLSDIIRESQAQPTYISEIEITEFLPSQHPSKEESLPQTLGVE